MKHPRSAVPASTLPRLSYRPVEVARLTGLSRAAAYRLVTGGTLRAVRVGRTWLIPADAVHQLIASARLQRESS
jgi:excisionase family DNA binding protein